MLLCAWITIALTVTGNVWADQQPCSRIAELVGDMIEFIRYDYYIGELTDWRISNYLDELAKYVKDYTRDGVDLSSTEEVEQLICEVLTAKKFEDVWKVLNEDNLPMEVNKDIACYYYQMTINDPDSMEMYDATLYQELYDFLEDFAYWMGNSEFPDTFPIMGSHSDNIEALTRFQQFVNSDLKWQHIFDDFLPVGIQYSYTWNETTQSSTPSFSSIDLEEIFGWMNDSKNVFDYASYIYEHKDLYMSVDRLQYSISLMHMYQSNYDKLLWIKEGIQLLEKSNLFHLDTSNCVSAPGRYDGSDYGNSMNDVY